MGKLDKAKEKIGILKFWLGLIIATLLAIIGYCITNYEKINFYLLILSILSAAFLAIIALLISNKINKKIDELEDL